MIRSSTSQRRYLQNKVVDKLRDFKITLQLLTLNKCFHSFDSFKCVFLRGIKVTVCKLQQRFSC